MILVISIISRELVASCSFSCECPGQKMFALDGCHDYTSGPLCMRSKSCDVGLSICLNASFHCVGSDHVTATVDLLARIHTRFRGCRPASASIHIQNSGSTTFHRLWPFKHSIIHLEPSSFGGVFRPLPQSRHRHCSSPHRISMGFNSRCTRLHAMLLITYRVVTPTNTDSIVGKFYVSRRLRTSHIRTLWISMSQRG